jgi:hypothetical protein
MTMSQNHEAPISEIHPLALNPFKPIHDIEGQKINSFMMALRTIDYEVQKIEHDQLQEFASRALYHITTKQAMTNYADVEPSEEYMEAAVGASDQPTMIRMLHEYPELASVEIARKTHVGVWNVQNIIDKPVRGAIDTVEDTERVDGKSRYKIKMFDEAGVLIERKNDVRSHFGGKVLTVIRNCLLIDYSSKDMPETLRRYLESEHDTLKSSKDNRVDYDYDLVHDQIGAELEDYVQNRSPDGKKEPKFVVPLLTTYYSYITK